MASGRSGLIALVIGVFQLVLPMSANAQERVALVIGNAIYDNGPNLRNPVNDASAIAEELIGLGYIVYYGENLDHISMSRTLLEFSKKLKLAKQVLVYFAGHGVQIDGVTFLMPTDAVMRSKADLITSITLNEVLDLLRDDLRASIVLVDACRDNPIYNTALTRSFSGDRIANSPPLFDLPYGMIIGYASRPGAVAYDGPLQHGPYAEALLSHLATPDLDVELMLRRVRNQVIQITKGAQVPWTQSSLLGEVVISTGSHQTKTVVTEPQVQLKTPDTATSGGQSGAEMHRKSLNSVLQAQLIDALCSALSAPLPIQCERSADP